jgi:mRNA-degrading endonuclease RelE of RelBE toxin-antitoxin system
LKHDANVETNRRKPLRPNRLSKWELRIRDYRVFYDVSIEEQRVKVVSVGVKRHNELVIRGEKVEL